MARVQGQERECVCLHGFVCLNTEWNSRGLNLALWRALGLSQAKEVGTLALSAARKI